MQCSSITAACSHIEGSGPHYTLARSRRAQLLGLAGAACTGCAKPAVQTNTHGNCNGSKGSGVVTDRFVEFQVDTHIYTHTQTNRHVPMGDMILVSEWHEEVGCWSHTSGRSGGGGGLWC